MAPTDFTITDELGATGLWQFAGQIEEEFVKDLKGDKARKTFREMSHNDPVVGALLFAIDMLVRQVDWRIEPADVDDEMAVAYSDFVKSCIDDMSQSWDDVITSIMSMLVFGWSYHEVVYKIRGGRSDDSTRNSQHDDGLIGWRKLPIRSQDTLYSWKFDEEGGIAGMTQSAPPHFQYVFIPIEKALLFRTTTQKNNPEGRSMLRSAYRPWFFKKRIEEIEAIGIERDLAGMPVAWVPPSMLTDSATDAERATLDAIRRIVRNIKRDQQEGIIFPLSYDEAGRKRIDLTLLSTGGRRSFDTDVIIGRYDQRIAMCVLADFILLGHENVGSFALGSSKLDLFTLALAAWLDEIAAIFNSYAIPSLLEVNGMDVALKPKLEHADVKQVDLTALGAYVGQLASAGMPLFPSDSLQEFLLEAANLPVSEDAEDVE